MKWVVCGKSFVFNGFRAFYLVLKTANNILKNCAIQIGIETAVYHQPFYSEDFILITEKRSIKIGFQTIPINRYFSKYKRNQDDVW